MSQDWSPTPAAAAPPAVKGTGLIWSGVVLLVVGLVVFIVGIVGVVTTAVDLARGFEAPISTPTTVTRTLDAGTTYAVYERSSLAGSGTAEDPLLATVSPEDVTVTGPGGVAVAVTDPGTLTQTFTSGSGEFFAVAVFDAPVTGTYEVTIATEGARVIVGPSLTAFGRSVAWAGAIGLGALLGLVGLVLLIVGIVRRSSSKKAAAAAVPAYGAVGYQQPAAYQQPVAPAVAQPAQPPIGEQPAGPPVAGDPVPAQPVAPVAAAPVAPQPAAPVSPPAGWYPDPGRPGGQRYWDGAAWTEHTA